MTTPTIIRTFVPELDSIAVSKFTFAGVAYNLNEPFPHKTLGVAGGPLERTQINGLWLAGLIAFVQNTGSHALVDGACPTCGRPAGEVMEAKPAVEFDDDPDEGEVAGMIADQRAKMAAARAIAKPKTENLGVVIDDPTSDEPDVPEHMKGTAVGIAMAGNMSLDALNKAVTPNPPARTGRVKNSPVAPSKP